MGWIVVRYSEIDQSGLVIQGAYDTAADAFLAAIDDACAYRKQMYIDDPALVGIKEKDYRDAETPAGVIPNPDGKGFRAELHTVQGQTIEFVVENETTRKII